MSCCKVPTLRQIYNNHSAAATSNGAENDVTGTSETPSLDHHFESPRDAVLADPFETSHDEIVTPVTSRDTMGDASSLTTVFNFEVTPPPDTSLTQILPDVVPKSYRRRLRHHRGSLTNQPSRYDIIRLKVIWSEKGKLLVKALI